MHTPLSWELQINLFQISASVLSHKLINKIFPDSDAYNYRWFDNSLIKLIQYKFS